MATSAAERQRRSRAHKKGDHSLCDPRRCDGTSPASDVTPKHVTAPPKPAVTPSPTLGDPPTAAGGIEAATEALVHELQLTAGDPRAVLGQIAIRLARLVDADDALPAAARELRVLLGQLGEVPGQPGGPVDELRVRRAQRRLDQILAAS